MNVAAKDLRAGDVIDPYPHVGRHRWWRKIIRASTDRCYVTITFENNATMTCVSGYKFDKQVDLPIA